MATGAAKAKTLTRRWTPLAILVAFFVAGAASASIPERSDLAAPNLSTSLGAADAGEHPSIAEPDEPEFQLFAGVSLLPKTRVWGFEVPARSRVDDESELTPTSRPGSGDASYDSASGLRLGLTLDPDLGWYYARNRWYDPETGSFTSSDPLGYPDSANPYVWGVAGPWASDPMGLLSPAREIELVDQRRQLAEQQERAAGYTSPGAVLKEAFINPLRRLWHAKDEFEERFVHGAGQAGGLVARRLISAPTYNPHAHAVAREADAEGMPIAGVGGAVIQTGARTALTEGAVEAGEATAELAITVGETEAAGAAARAAEELLAARRARMAAIRAQGAAGEALMEAEAVTAGEVPRGKHVTFELPSGRRTVSDLVTDTPEGKLKVREAKKGASAQLSPGQREMQDTSSKGGTVVPRGAKARKAGLPPGQPVRVDEFEEDRYK